MGIVSILFLISGWFNAIKGLVITSLILSSIFALSFIIGIVFVEHIPNGKKETYIINGIIQIIVLILSIVKLVKGF